MRIGILGGTFNPVHKGHLYIAKQALKKLSLDRIIFIPTYIPPHKKIRGNVSARDRVHMLQLAVAGERRFSVSEYEIKKGGTSYSIDTVKYLKRRLGKSVALFFIIGADSLAGLTRWHNIEKLRELVRFVVVPRQGFRLKSALCRGITILRIPKKDISSSKIRELIRRKKAISHLVPIEVEDYIRAKALYG